MDFLSTLYQLIFMPLQIIFEVIYYLVFKLIGNPGISIIALSFIVNLLVNLLPFPLLGEQVGVILFAVC